MIWRSWQFLLALALCACLSTHSFAQTRPFIINGQTVMLERAENSVGAYLRAFRPNLATGRWDVDVTVTNGSTRVLNAPIILRFDVAEQIAPEVAGATLDANGLPFFNITPLVADGLFQPGQALRTFTLSLGDGQTRPNISIGIYAAPQSQLIPLAAVRTLTDDGLPMEGVVVEEIGPTSPRSVVTGRGGSISLEVATGVRAWKFSAPGKIAAHRLVPASSSARVTELISPRLVTPATTGPTLFATANIPAPIPNGWSPLAAAQLPTGSFNLDLGEPLESGAEAMLARWDDAALGWRMLRTVIGPGPVQVESTDTGIFAVLRADASPTAPPVPTVNQIVVGIAAPQAPSALAAVGAANPSSRTANTNASLVQTEATVQFTSPSGPLSSGLTIPCEIFEEYILRDGTRRILPSYRMLLVGYQRPSSAPGSISARFSLRPFQLLAGEDLSEATIRVQVLKPAAFDGGVFEPTGGTLMSGAIAINAAAGDFAKAEAGILQELTFASTNGIAPAGVEIARAFELSIPHTQTGRRLSVDLGPQQPNQSYVLARAVFDQGRHGFQPVQRFSSAANGNLSTTEPLTGALPGIDGGGQFILFKTSAPEALVSGVARDATGAPKGELQIKRGPWTAFSDANGQFRLLAPAGSSAVTVIDPISGDTGSSFAEISPDLAPVQIVLDSAPRGPFASISPTTSSTNVSRVTAVVISFTRPINPVTIAGSGVQLLNSTNGIVPGSVTLNLAGTVVTILPSTQLAAAEVYRVRIAATVTDLLGRPVEGNREFNFTTAPESFIRGLAGQITIYEPGATNLTSEILAKIPAYDPTRDHDGIVVEASQGTAEPGGKVILVNESTGQTATILADTDGSFVTTVRGSVEDFISAVLVNANGTRNQIPATRQRFDDGSIGLFASGGTISSQGPGTSIDFIVEPGAVKGKTVFKIESMTASSFQELVGGNLPPGAAAPVGAFELTESGEPLQVAADISLPVRLADLGLPPGSHPTNFAFVVTMPVLTDGKILHQVVDTAAYEPTGPEGGRVRTQSPPFVGMLARKLAELTASAGMSAATPVKIAVNSDNPHKGQTAVFGILPIQSLEALPIGGFVRAVTKNEDGSESTTPLPGAVVRSMRLEDQDDPGNNGILFEGDLVSISDERGNFGFFFKPSFGDVSRQLIGTHARFPFQKARSGPFVADRTGATAVTAELRFTELPASLVTADGLGRPEVSVGHDPALPAAGTAPTAGATVFVTAVDDKEVSPPTLEIVRVENLQGAALALSEASKSALTNSADTPARKLAQFRVTMKQAGRVILKATASDNQTAPREVQHAISFGVTRPPVNPTDPADIANLRVIFSWPPTGGTNVPSLTPITLRFNRSLPSSILQPGQLSWLTFGPGHFIRRVTPSADRREITIFYDGPATNEVKLTVGPGITGESGREFDQNNLEQSPQPFVVHFKQTINPVVEFEGQSGAGVVMLGRFAYQLERNGLNGIMRVLDFEDPSEPEEIHTINLGYPTAMSLIPRYSMPDLNGLCSTQNLVALFTGHANEPKFLQLGAINDGDIIFGPKLIMSGGGTDGSGRRSVGSDSTITESLSQIVKSKWDPPYLGYFELGADITSIKLINLTAFQRVAEKRGVLETFQVNARNDGTDANGDGDFCDPSDVMPIPDGNPVITPGLAFSFAPKIQSERIEDFDFHAGLGVLFTISRFTDPALKPRFSTVLAGGDTNNLDSAFVEFTSFDSPRRVLFLPSTTLETPTNRIIRDIALVTLGQASGDGAIAAIDVTTPSNPTLINRFSLPANEGTPSGIQRRDDGFLIIATTQGTLLINPEKLAASNAGITHPSIVGRIPTPGTGVRDFVADPTGINLTHGGGTRKFVQTAPRFSFVRFNAVVNPNVIADQPESITAGFLNSATPIQVAEVTQAPRGETPGAPDPTRHYYVLADIPGGAADGNGNLRLVLSAVDALGLPQPDIGGTVVPAVVGDEQLESALLGRRVIDLFFSITKIKKAAGEISEAVGLLAKIRSALGNAKTAKKALDQLAGLGKALSLLQDDFEARRLSHDPDSPLYNKFLAGPFIILGGAPTIADLTALSAQADDLEITRAYLRPSPRLWVGLPSERVGGLLASINPFTPSPSKLKPFVSELRLNPSISVFGVTVPHSAELITQLANINTLNPGTSFFDLGQQITLIVSLVNNAPLAKMILKGDWKPLLIPGAHQMIRVNYNDRPMIFVPGFAGSQLEITNANHWLGVPGQLLDRKRDQLRVNPDGTPVATTYATDAVRYVIDTSVITLESIYGDWLSHLTAEMGLVEYNFLRRDTPNSPSPNGEQVRKRLRLADGVPILSQAPIPSLFVFPYDWRLDNQKSAVDLKEYVRVALEMHPDADGVDLVAHSNGGLVSRAYMLLPGQRSVVKRFITVGTPWLGSPKPLSGLRTGDINEASINLLAPIPAVRAMLQFSPGAHQLLPSSEYFDFGFRPLVEDGFDVNTNGLPNEVFTFDGYMEALAKYFLRKPVLELTNVTLNGDHPVRANANGFRIGKFIGDHRQDTDGIETHHIVGMGAQADTIGQVRVRGRIVTQTNTTNVTISLARVATRETEQVRDGADVIISPSDGFLAVSETNQYRLNEEIELRYVSGDGTVPIASLVRGYRSGDKDLNAPQAKIHALVGGSGDKITGHNPMLNEDQFLKLFDNVYLSRPVPEVEVTIGTSSFSEGASSIITVSGTRPPEETSGEISYVVDFGDGSVELNHGSAGVQFPHRYRQSGKYLVTVGAATKNGFFGIASKNITVANEPPQVSIFGGSFTCNLGESRILTAIVNDPGLDDRHSFIWRLPDGSASGLNQFAVPVTFNEPGQKNVTVEVTDTDGATVQASITVTVRSQPPTTAGPNFGPDPAEQNNGLAQAPIFGFVGGHPEIIVRVNGHALNAFGTAGLGVRQTLGDAVLESLIAAATFDFFDISGLTPDALMERAVLPLKAKFLGQLGQDSEYARMVRELPSQIIPIDFSAKRAWAAARGKGQPIEVDVLLLNGGIAKILHRWRIPNVSSSEGVRMHFDWPTGAAVLERVLPNPVTGSPMTGFPLESIAPIFSTSDQNKAGDRQGPATLGILNPATDTVYVLARDNLTVATNVSKFVVFDANENGRFDDDVFYPLDTNVVNFARLPKRPFAIVGVDEQGNVGGLDPFALAETRNFLVDKKEGDDVSEYEKKLKKIRTTVREAINEAIISPEIVGKYLLNPSHLWIFEQGSGANLWKPDFVQRCNGIYLPGKSDNDYELFFPVKVETPYPFTEAGRTQFTNDGPYEITTLTGDWYFQRPTGLDAGGNQTEDDGAIVEWEFTLPAPFLFGGQSTFRVARADNDDNLGSGFNSPLTPAELIARVFTKAITDNDSRRKIVADTTFFPERREHFMFGQLHLERPPEFGDDPIGDGGTGRQLLLLKWLMEGAYVTASDESGGADLAPGAPTLAQIFDNWKRTGVPVAEGFEWGVFQDFAALKSKPFQTIAVRLSSQGATDNPRLLNRYYDDAALSQQASRLKKLGKSAIRATLARLAGDTNLNALVAGVSSDQVIVNPARSYEDFILALARSNADARAALGDFANDRDDKTEPPDIGDFLRAKKADRQYLETILTTPGAYERFVTATFQFLRQQVQTPTRKPYTNYTDNLRLQGQFAEFQQRNQNLNLVVRGRGASQPGLLTLNSDRRISQIKIPMSVEVYSPVGVGSISVFKDNTDGGPAPAPFPTPTTTKKKKSLLASDETEPITVIDGAPDEDETVADGETSTEGPAVMEGSIDDSNIETEITAVSGAADGWNEDNTTVVEATAFDPAIPSPAISDGPAVVAWIAPHIADDLFVLDDWPTNGVRPRSPRFHLRRTDRLEIEILSTPGSGPYTADVTSESDPVGLQVALTDRFNNGAFINKGAANMIRFSATVDDPNDDRIYVKDEEILTIRVSGEDVDKELKFSIDLGEFSIATLLHTDRTNTIKARFDYEQRFLNLTNFTAFDFFNAGFVQFPDDVAAAVNGGDNPMRRYIQNFADPSIPLVGEADLLYINAHGNFSGQLGDHVSNTNVSARRLVIDPAPHLATPGHWRSDAEWLIMDACAALNADDFAAGGQPAGAGRWRSVLTNLNGSVGRKLPHGILSFDAMKPARRGPHQQFLGLIELGVPYVPAWRDAMTAHAMPWATLSFASAEKDTVREISQDQVQDGPINYREETVIFSDVQCEECDGIVGPGLNLHSLEENLEQTGSFSSELPAVEEILRARGYEPSQMRLSSLGEEAEIRITKESVSERKRIAKIYHWKLGDDPIAVRIGSDGTARILDSRLSRSTGGRP